jgi:hypothetical protein
MPTGELFAKAAGAAADCGAATSALRSSVSDAAESNARLSSDSLANRVQNWRVEKSLRERAENEPAGRAAPARLKCEDFIKGGLGLQAEDVCRRERSIEYTNDALEFRENEPSFSI